MKKIQENENGCSDMDTEIFIESDFYSKNFFRKSFSYTTHIFM